MTKIKRSQIEDWSLDRLNPYANNAKLHPDSHVEQIANSIEEFTFLDPIAVDEKGEILEGHGRLLAAQKRGDKSVPVIVVSGLTEAQKVAYRLAHNKLTMNTGFDFELLKIDFEFLQDEGFNLDLTGFNELELSFLDEEEEEETKGEGVGGEDDYEQPDEIESRVKLGEIWQLGRHKIACGDSTIESNVRALLGDRFGDVGMVWADPPYGINAVNKDGGSSFSAKPCAFGGVNAKGKLIAKNKYAPVIGDSSGETARNAFTTASIFKCTQVWWGANNYPDVLPPSTCWIVWNKETNGNLADAELAWSNHASAVRLFTHTWNGLVKASEHGQKRVHPTQKPIALCEWFFEKYGKLDDLVFDPFLGSAPSIIAAEKVEGDRTVYGFELSPDYCEVIIQRWEKFTGKQAELIGKLDDSAQVSEPSNEELEKLGF
ncbi:MAG: DNA methyltransferase [Dolichospermum sp.]